MECVHRVLHPRRRPEASRGATRLQERPRHRKFPVLITTFPNDIETVKVHANLTVLGAENLENATLFETFHWFVIGG
jgi:hypothetical protein